MEIGSTIILLIGLILFVIALVFVYRSAGAISNKYGMIFSIATIMSALPLILTATTDILSKNFSPIGIPPYLIIFIAEIAVFAGVFWSWLRILNRVSSLKTLTETLTASVKNSDHKIENLSTELVRLNKSINEISIRIDARYKEYENITKTPV
jgi:hypothetical protein